MFTITTLTPYTTNLVIVASKEPDKAIAQLNVSNPGLELELWRETADAYTCQRFYKPQGSKYETQFLFLVFDTSRTNGEILAEVATHEAIHAKNYVMSHHGLLHSFDNDEAEAYLTGYIVKLIGDHLQQSRKKPKNFKWKIR